MHHPRPGVRHLRASYPSPSHGAPWVTQKKKNPKCFANAFARDHRSISMMNTTVPAVRSDTGLTVQPPRIQWPQCLVSIEHTFWCVASHVHVVETPIGTHTLHPRTLYITYLLCAKPPGTRGGFRRVMCATLVPMMQPPTRSRMHMANISHGRERPHNFCVSF